MWIDERGSQVLDPAECRRLLALGATQGEHGHVGIPGEGAPLLLPVDYAVTGPDVVVRVGDAFCARMVGRLVAFEVDGGTRGSRPWSVLVRGLAIELPMESYVGRLPHPRVAFPGRRLVRIRVDRVSGRRLGAAASRRQPAGAGAPGGAHGSS